MLRKHAADLPARPASDGCLLAEVIHPQNDGTSRGLSLARARLAPGQSTRPHRLDFLEIYYFLAGRGVMHLAGEKAAVEPDDCVYLPPGQVQWLQNTGQEDLVFLCVCHPAYDPAGDHDGKAPDSGKAEEGA